WRRGVRVVEVLPGGLRGVGHAPTVAGRGSSINRPTRYPTLARTLPRYTPMPPAANPPAREPQRRESLPARFARLATEWSGTSAAFGLAALTIVVWLASGPFFG